MTTFHSRSICNLWTPCRVPQDINLDSSSKSASVSSESPKVNKPLSPYTKKTAQESPKPSSPCSMQSSPGAGGAPSLPTHVASSPNPAGASSSPKPIKSPRTYPVSPGSYGLGAVSGYHPGEGSSGSQSEWQL
jgi:hypothetical protein